MVSPFWEAGEQPRFLSRTSSAYARVPLQKTLNDRGLDNRLLTSLVENLPDGAYIAGGFMLSILQGDKNATDIDIFFNGEEAFRKTYEMLLNPSEDDDAWAFRGYLLQTDKSVVEGSNSKSLRFVKFGHEKRPPIQLIKLAWYESAEHVIDSFDFTIAQIATDKDNLILNPLTVFDAVRKRIVLHRMQFPASTMRRLVKYAGKGYYACPGALSSIATAVHEAISENPALNEEDFVYLD